MFHRVKSSSETAIHLFPEKENIVRVLRGFEVVANDFLEYVFAGAGMSTSWCLNGNMHEFFFIAKEEHVRFTNVLAKKWSGTLKFREVPLVDRFIPSFYFQSEEFVAKLVAVQEVERLADGLSSTNVPTAVLHEVSGGGNSGFVDASAEFFEDNKEGVMDYANKRKCMWENVRKEVEPLAAIRCLRQHWWFSSNDGSSKCGDGEDVVIGLSDDPAVGDKNVVLEGGQQGGGLSEGASSNSEKMVSLGDYDQGKNLDVAVVGGHIDNGFGGEWGFFSLGVVDASVSTGDYSSGIGLCHSGLGARMLDYLFFWFLRSKCVTLPPGTLAKMASYSLVVESKMGMVVAEKKSLEKRVAVLDAENVVVKEELEKVK
ncbi:unnamed protein product [Lactuca virosa]|uniref:Uncharacterized protein n=1 Tax=Lactuca virosa TaxID=75947 RepID=A0AAU9LNH9_9ASTR|nr:unnamed protein product [Lactuca virosa]